MATSKEIFNESSKLKMMSLDDFLQEEIPRPLKEESGSLFSPFSLQWEKVGGRWNNENNRRHKIGVDTTAPSYLRGMWRGRGNRGPSRGPRKEGLRAGVLMAHDPPAKQPLTRNPTRPMKSIIALGNGEAALVKDNTAPGFDGEHEEHLEAVLTNASSQQEVKFVLDQQVSDAEAGQHCHFLPVDDLTQVRRNTVLKLLVGLLNTGHRGVIYLGVSDDGRVEGVNAEPQLMVQFVEGIMKTVRYYLMPRLHTPQYGVRYTNVITSSGQQLNNLWVVELHAVPQMQHYYNPVMDMNYHVRHGKETKTLPFADFCQTIVAEASKGLDSQIQGIEERINHLRKTLEDRGIDTRSRKEAEDDSHLCDKCWLNDCPVQCYGRLVSTEE